MISSTNTSLHFPYTKLTAICLSSLIASTTVCAQDSTDFHKVATLFGGVSGLNSSHSTQTFPGSDSQLFSYTNNNNQNNTPGFIGLLLGAERNLGFKNLFALGGIEYTYNTNANITGNNTVGIEPDTSTHYSYLYKTSAQQLLATAKLFSPVELTACQHSLLPYLSLGLGASFNNTNNYSTHTNETESLNITPNFSNQTHTSFSYALGLGVESYLNEHIRLGLGYRFTDIGASQLGNGTVTINDYHASTGFALSTQHSYLNQFLLQATYRL